MANQAHTTSRRRFLAAAAFASVFPGVVTAKAVSLEKQLDDAIRKVRFFEATHHADSDFEDREFERLLQAVWPLVDEIEALSIESVDVLRLKVKAAQWCDESAFKLDLEYTGDRIISEILRSILYSA